MQEIFEKIIERLEVEVEYQNDRANESDTFEEISVSKARRKMAECYEHAIEIVNQVAEEFGADINAGSNDGWIPCSEMLPEKSGNYIVCSKYGTWVANWFCNTWWGIEKKCRWTNVIAWKPFPAPYKPKGEK